MISTLNINQLSAIFFDFDGVLTSNKVFVDEVGTEMVCCNRSDGLAFDVLKRIGIPVFIISTETNPVVSARGKKLGVKVIQGVEKKEKLLSDISKNENIDLKNALYVGNDLNDYYVMQSCGFSVCPADSHLKIKELSNVVLNTRGGEGVARELLEDVLGLDFIEILYNE